ncbi:MAG: M55 family metallopeptidase [Firmicutes bacterium]|nr:M55 family metallopeptidase [Bacillota bacterium]
MKIYVSADMEGIGGVVFREQLVAGEVLYEEARRLLTAEVNAVVQCLLEQGVEEVVVKDAHRTGLNFCLEELHPGARYAIGGFAMRDRFAGLDESFSGAFLIGYHAMGGTRAAIRDHTMTALTWQSLELGGRAIGEIGLDALLFGLYGVPVVLVAGDDKACAEARSELGQDVVTYETKRAYARHAGLIQAPATVRKGYGDAVAAALASCGRRPPMRVPGPYELRIRFMSTELADARRFDGIRDERIDGLTAVYRDEDLVALLGRAL